MDRLRSCSFDVVDGSSSFCQGLQRARCDDSGDMRKETSFQLVLKLPDARRLRDLA